MLVALRRTGDAEGRAALKTFLKDADPEIRRTAIQWVGEEGLKEFAPQLQTAAAQAPTTPALFRALLAAKHLLNGGKPDAEPIDETYLAKVVEDAAQPSAFRVLALRMLRPDHPALSSAGLGKLLTGGDPALRREALRTLTLRTDKAARELLLQVANDDGQQDDFRADAVLGLANFAADSAEARRCCSPCWTGRGCAATPYGRCVPRRGSRKSRRVCWRGGTRRRLPTTNAGKWPGRCSWL